MVANEAIRRLEAACTEIGEALADPGGFVPMRTLLERFRAEIDIRPLLVEGMLASLPTLEGATSAPGPRWRVLIDSERSGISHVDVSEETASRPLPVRWRNTIAHELVHALAFTQGDGSPQVRAEFGSEAEGGDWVRVVEQATERVTPLLLVPQKALSAQIRRRTTPLSAAEVRALASHFAVSRDVLIQRLNLLRAHDPEWLLERPALKGIAIGTGIWQGNSDAELSPWPLFSNFERNIEPQLVLQLRAKQKVSLLNYAGSSSALQSLAQGGAFERPGEAGLLTQPALREMRTLLELEPVRNPQRHRFFFVIRDTEGGRQSERNAT